MAQYFVRSTKSAKTFPAILAAALSSCSSLHTTHQGVWVGKHTRKLKTFEIPTPGPNEILIRSERFGCGRGPTYAQILKLDVAVSSNPKDWKIPMIVEGWESIEGNDVAGTAVQLGDHVKGFKVGDRVAANTRSRTAAKYGAYAEFSVSPDNTVCLLEGNSSFEEASTIPLAYTTAVLGLYQHLKLPDKCTSPIPILVWGSASTVGINVVQLAKKSGLYVVGIAGSSIDHARQYGLDEVIDYRGKSAAELGIAISNSAGGQIRHVFDAISESGSIDAISHGLGSQGGTVAHVLDYSETQLASLPVNIKLERISSASAHNDPVDMEAVRQYFVKLGGWLKEGSFKGQKVTVVAGGLSGVEEGLKRLRNGQVRGEKLVYRISETPRYHPTTG